MQVETYEQTEMTSAGPECDAEAIALIESLGLTGQQELITRPDGDAVRNPYRLMTEEELCVYSLLMPKHVEISKYSDGPIPLRVLQVAAHARDLGLPVLRVWCPATGPKDDPILVAREHDYTSKIWLLARWGDALLPMEELAKKAAALARDGIKTALLAALEEVRGDLSMIDAMPASQVLKWSLSAPTYHRNRR